MHENLELKRKVLELESEQRALINSLKHLEEQRIISNIKQKEKVEERIMPSRLTLKTTTSQNKTTLTNSQNYNRSNQLM